MIDDRKKLMQPCLYKARANASEKPLPLARHVQLVQKQSSISLTKNETRKSEPQAIIDMTRSLQDVSDCNQFDLINHQRSLHFHSESTVNGYSVSPLCKNHFVEPLSSTTVTNTVVNKHFHDATTKPSPSGTVDEGIYHYVYNLASPHCTTTTTG